MTAKRAIELLGATGAVLLDFDGPVTPLMPAPINRHVADTARHALQAAGIKLSAEAAETTDHLTVLRYTWTHHRDRLGDVEAACIAGEVEAARVSAPTPGAHDFLTACSASGVPVAIVSNNSVECVAEYLVRHNLRESVSAVTGREPLRPDLMKPNGHALRVACAALAVPVAKTLMVGDSLSDVAAARSVSASVIGFGKNPERARELRRAGADAIVLEMRDLASAISLSRHKK